MRAKAWLIAMCLPACEEPPQPARPEVISKIAPPTSYQVEAAKNPPKEKTVAEFRARNAEELALFEEAENVLNDVMDGETHGYYAAHQTLHRSGKWAAVRIQFRFGDADKETIERCLFFALQPNGKTGDDYRPYSMNKNGAIECPKHLDDEHVRPLARRAGMPWK